MEHAFVNRPVFLILLAFLCCSLITKTTSKAQETEKTEETERVKAKIINDIHAGILSLKGKYEALADFDARSLGPPDASGRPGADINYHWERLSDKTRYGTITLFIRWSDRDYLPQFGAIGGPVTDDFRVKGIARHLWGSLLTNEGFPATKQERISAMFEEIRTLIREATGSAKCERKTMYNYAWNYCE